MDRRLVARRPAVQRALATLALSAALGVAARAQDADVDTENRHEVASLEFVGVERIDEGDLVDVLATRESPWLPWASPHYFDPESFEVDLRRIVAYYQDHGFPDARVTSHDLDVDDDAREVAITIHVDEGDPVIIGEVALEGFAALPAGRIDTLRDELPIAAGDVAVHPLVLAGAERAVTALKNEGYAHAEVRVEQDEIAPKRRRIRYVAEPGVQAYFGPIEIVGNASVDANVVRRQLVYRPGEQYRIDQVRESQRQLYSLELFQFATIEPLDSSGATEVRTRVTVAEGDHRRVMFAGGWGAEEKLNGELAWRHVNFYGGARVLAASGKWSSLDRGGEVDFRQPYLFHPNLALALNGHAWFADELAYQARSEGGRATVEGRVGANTGWRATYTHEFASSQIMEAARADLTQRETLIALGLDPATGRQEGALSSLAFELQHATPDDPLNPRAGYSAALFAEQAGTVLAGTFNYTNISTDVRGFVPLGERVVLSGRLHGAFIDPVGAVDNVPFFKRYFLGGSTSLRGWGRFEISPLSSSGLPLGGFSLFEATAEVQARLWGNLGAALFVDGGNVWSDAWTLRPGDLRYDVGPGLLYRTPIGPLRVDFGYQLTPVQGLVVDGQPQSRRWRIHFRIGQG